MTALFIDRAMESEYPPGRLKLLTKRARGTAANISRVEYPREVKIRACDHGTLIFDTSFLIVVKLN